jgi:hypothetical protein
VNISVAKSTPNGNSTIEFDFECDGIPCTSRTATISHLTFDNVVDFTDVTTVAIQGTISIADTKPFNTAGNPCPIEGARVCAVNHYGSNEKFVCRDTDLNGVCAQVLFFMFSCIIASCVAYGKNR